MNAAPEPITRAERAIPEHRHLLPWIYRALIRLMSLGLSVLRRIHKLLGRDARVADLAERLARKESIAELPRDVIWVHGASVGEIRAVGPLLDVFKRRFPDVPVLLTTQTTTGRDAARRLADHVVLAPLDARPVLQRFLKRVRPRLHVIVETEIWPNRLNLLHKLRVPVALVSAKLSAERWDNYRRLRSLYRRPLATLSLVSPAESGARERLEQLGAAEEVFVEGGSLKWDAAPVSTPSGRAPFEEWQLDRSLRWFVLGSIHPREASALIRAFYAVRPHDESVGFLVAPRHPHRFDRIAEELLQLGRPLRRISASEHDKSRDARIVLVDVLGALPHTYADAYAAFVGGTFVSAVGGHSPLEAARAGCPVLAGPHHAQQVELLAPLVDAGAAVLTDDAASAANRLCDWLNDRAARDAASDAARRVVSTHRGVAERVGELVLELLR